MTTGIRKPHSNDVARLVMSSPPSRLPPMAPCGPPPLSCGSPLWAAAMLMLRSGVRHLPVTEDGQVVGMLSIREALDPAD